MSFEIGDLVIYPEGDIWQYLGYNTIHEDNHAIMYISGGDTWYDKEKIYKDSSINDIAKLYKKRMIRSNKPGWF